MKKYLLLLVLYSNFAFSQNNIDFVQIIKNKRNFYEGEKGTAKDLKVTFDSVHVNAMNEKEILVDGIIESGSNIYEMSGKITFDEKETKRMRDPSIYNFNVILNESSATGKAAVFKGSLNMKIMPRLFNVVVFEGVWEENKVKLHASFDNSKEIMKYLESLKK